VILSLPLAAMILLDLQNVFAGIRRVLKPAAPSSDYTLLVPLYGHPRYFANADRLLPYRDRVLLAIVVSTPLMATFADEAERAGWRVHRCRRNLPLPELVADALASVETSYVIRMDGDTWFAGDPGAAVGAAAEAAADLCSVKVLPSRRRTLAERLQGIEYDMAMLGRHHRPWLTSGACMLARTDALREILSHHSSWFAGEDIETGVIARRLGMTVRHVDTVVHTDVPESWPALARQRVNWWAGCFRHSWINADFGLHEPIGLLYSAILVWGLFIGRIVSLDQAWRLVPTLVVLYTGVCIVGNWRVRNRMMILYPYYALLSSVLLPAFGVIAYLRLARSSRNLGRLRVPRGRAARAARRARRAQAASRNLKYAA
jgi:hypothetical protein